MSRYPWPNGIRIRFSCVKYEWWYPSHWTTARCPIASIRFLSKYPDPIWFNDEREQSQCSDVQSNRPTVRSKSLFSIATHVLMKWCWWFGLWLGYCLVWMPYRVGFYAISRIFVISLDLYGAQSHLSRQYAGLETKRPRVLVGFHPGRTRTSV